MSAATHTPGPWKFHLGRGKNPRFHVQTTGGYQIASTPEVSRHGPEAVEQEQNARTIAATPTLFAALDNLADYLDFLESRGEIPVPGEYRDSARQALNLARGVQ